MSLGTVKFGIGISSSMTIPFTWDCALWGWWWNCVIGGGMAAVNTGTAVVLAGSPRKSITGLDAGTWTLTTGEILDGESSRDDEKDETDGWGWAVYEYWDWDWSNDWGACTGKDDDSGAGGAAILFWVSTTASTFSYDFLGGIQWTIPDPTSHPIHPSPPHSKSGTISISLNSSFSTLKTISLTGRRVFWVISW